ncbi:hypothetical protein M0802_001219 [Mischocyttarus mexicanus]|nr:hypothetical protein M0802_001219 [Mischocyttarus mexicanus]
MSEKLRTQRLGTLSNDDYIIQTDEEIQYAPRSRPVSFYDNFKDVSIMPTCVTSAMSVGNLSQVRENDTSSNIPQTSNNNNNNNNRVSSAMSAGNVSKIHPVRVTGALSTGNIGKTCRIDKIDKELGRAPSMANCLSTTVPVNLAASQIAGRHTPTRNSLRHSRMIVLNRTGQRAQKFLPPLVYHGQLGRCLAALQTIIGIAIISLSLWLLLWTPNLPITDNPYWSGMPTISGLLAITASVACILACISAAVHLAHLMRSECTPARVLNATCVCRPRGWEQGNSTMTTIDELSMIKYLDLNCPEVESILTILLIFSSTCNAFGAIISVWYSYLHWSTRRKRPKYVPVRTMVFDSSR